MTNKFTTHVKQPFVRVVKRDKLPMWQNWLYRLIAIVLAFGLVSVFIYSVTGEPIFPTESKTGILNIMWEGSFGSIINAQSSLVLILKLLLISVALAPAFKMKFWNIGAEGQVLAGALGTAIVMVAFETLPNHFLIPLMFVSAVLFGAFWGFLPAVFKAKWGVNETLFTLMMNYIAICCVKFFTDKNKGTNSQLGVLNQTTEKGYLPKILGDWNLIAIVVVLAITIAMYIYLKYTKQGYEIAVVGESVNTAKYAGISINKTIIRTMLISGIICGICGFLTVAGEDHGVSETTAGGYGFTAIIVAWLAKFNTLFMIVISAFIIFLQQGTKHVSDFYSDAGFDQSAAQIVVGIVLFFVIGCEFFINYSLKFRHGRKGA